MHKLILIRYAEYDPAGHITAGGKQTMEATAKRLQPVIEGKSVWVIAAAATRATESAQSLAHALGLNEPITLQELYAADEENKLPDCKVALDAIHATCDQVDVVLAVVSREYIEALPTYIATQKFDKSENIKISLDRGEALVINFDEKDISRLS